MSGLTRGNGLGHLSTRLLLTWRATFCQMTRRLLLFFSSFKLYTEAQLAITLLHNGLQVHSKTLVLTLRPLTGCQERCDRAR